MIRAAGGRVLLGDRRPGDPPIPDELLAALREWAAFAVTAGGAVERDLVRRRGRLLASRVADVRGRPVEFVDPVSGTVEQVRAGGTGPIGPVPAQWPRLAVERPGPTPWATGLAVATFFAVFVAIADVVLSQAFAEAFGLWWIPANLLVGLGMSPSLYLLRAVPFWRWPAIGAAVGLVAAWLVLLVGLLG